MRHRPRRGDRLTGALRAFARQQQGQTIIEFALAVIVLLVIVLGLLDLGRAVSYSDTLSLAAREGTRYAIVHGSQCTTGCPAAATSQPQPTTCPAAAGTVTAVVCQYLVGVNSAVTVNVSWPDVNQDPGSRVSVSVTTPFSPFASSFFIKDALQATLSGSSTLIIRQ